MSPTMFPTFRAGRFTRRPEEVLLLCFYDPTGISTVPELVSCMQECSEFPITVVNLFEHGRHGPKTDGYQFCLPPELNLARFDAVVVHNTVAYNVANLRRMDALLHMPLCDFSGVKILMRQDENFRFRELAEYVGETGFDLIFTCLPEEAVPLIYPEDVVGSVQFSRMLTGYVTPTLRRRWMRDTDRPIDIGYRGSFQPYSFGRLAYEKRKIGEDVSRLLKGTSLRCDISSRWEDRIGGEAWFEFLSSCKATLGVESGASVFDLNGDLEARCRLVEAKYGPPREDEDYAEQYLQELADLEGLIYYNQIAPRHFEAVSTHTLQIMYPGEYSGIFVAGRHFVELQRDYSNFEQAVEILCDDKARLGIADCAYEEILHNQAYWIESFVDEFDRNISDLLESRQKSHPPIVATHAKRRRILSIISHHPLRDPRPCWIAQAAAPEFAFIQLGLTEATAKRPHFIETDEHTTTIAEKRIPLTMSMLRHWYSLAGANDSGWAALSEISYIMSILELDHLQFAEHLGAPLDEHRLAVFRCSLQFVLNTTASLVSTIERMRGFEAVIAADLDTLPAALIVKGLTGVPVLYDAHEYWPEADVEALEFEKEFWIRMEQRLVRHVDHRQTVSPGLAHLMSETYGCEFASVPNCEPLSAAQGVDEVPKSEDGRCRFIFQGGFAAMRGLDLLIDSWPDTDERAILLLRGPDCRYKDEMIHRARRTGLLGKRILFPKAVDVDELVVASREGDVALVPYAPSGNNHVHCCPNKLSQYMAAGMPILANNTSFVRHILEDAQAGLVTDFSKAANIAAAVSWFIDNPRLRQIMGKRANRYFRESFNWNVVSAPMYERLSTLVGVTAPSRFELFEPTQTAPFYTNKPHTRMQERQQVIAPPLKIEQTRIWTLARRLWWRLPQRARRYLAPLVNGVCRPLLAIHEKQLRKREQKAA